MNRYRPERVSHVPALFAAVALTIAMLAGVHAEAEPQQCGVAVASRSTSQMIPRS